MNKTISLSTPLVFGKQEISALELRQPTAGDLRGIKLTAIMDLDVSTILTLTARISLTPMPTATLDAMSPADLANLSAGIADFFNPAPTTETASPTTH